MCGIVGYAGSRQAAPILLYGLSKLEYRGYDSAGICVRGKDGLQIVKTKGRLQMLKDRIGDGARIRGTVGIGHTRWATHGAPSDENSHPHLSDSGKIVLVHNGIIENESRLRQWLERKGVAFHTQTDTEVIASLIGYYYAQSGDFLQSVRKCMTRLRGSYALGIMCTEDPGTVVAVKKDSPLIFGFGEREHFVASDVPAILKYTNEVAYLEDGEMAVFNGQTVRFYNAAGDEIEKESQCVTWQAADAERGGYAHFMLKEIFEQPKALRDTVLPRLKNGQVVLDLPFLSREYLEKLRKICFVACGSAYYVALLAKYGIESTCRISAQAQTASEFRYSCPVVGEHDLVVLISQSGETADTLAALREAKRLGATTLAIVNVVGSAIAKEADGVLYTWAGPEIAVATTKAFSAQLAVAHLLTLYIAQSLDTLSKDAYRRIVAGLETLPSQMEKVLSKENLEKIQYYASRYYNHHNAFYIGRNTDSALCREGSLKLKEIAYLHSEAYPAGELKHGPISLVDHGMLVVALTTVEALFEKTMANIREVIARGGEVLCVALEDHAREVAAQVDSIITIPKAEPLLQPSLGVIPLQLFAYYMALNRGCDVDKPRNLAKSVTVE